MCSQSDSPDQHAETCSWPREDRADSPLCGHTASAVYLVETAEGTLRYPACRVHDTPFRKRVAAKNRIKRIDLTPAKPVVADDSWPGWALDQA